jgi:predicted aldo/keto reductase-like oxidoreductase
VIDALINDPDKFFDTVLVGYNMKSDPSVKQSIARAKAAGLGVIAMKIQAAARGGNQAAISIPPEQAAAALKWVLQDTNVTNAIAGMRTLEHVRQMFPVMGAMKMTSADERIVRRYSAAIDKEFCRLCAKCEPTCPKGVRIGVVNRALMYAQAYGEHELGRETFREAAHARLCSACPECTARCVNGINIAAKMADARRLFA